MNRVIMEVSPCGFQVGSVQSNSALIDVIQVWQEAAQRGDVSKPVKLRRVPAVGIGHPESSS